MSALDAKIDELYQQPAGEFTTARNALAKTLSGADAARVRALPKPTVVPWVVNQVYWRARGAFDRLRKSGERLRAAQIAALKGRSADLRAATEAHRKAIAEAAAQAVRIAQTAGVHPGADELTRTLEALSLAPEMPEPPGRLTRSLRPAGFEALTGVTPVAVPAQTAPQRRQREQETSKRQEDDDRRREVNEARRAEAELAKAEAVLDRAKAAETRARIAWERAKRDVESAERSLARQRAHS